MKTMMVGMGLVALMVSGCAESGLVKRSGTISLESVQRELYTVASTGASTRHCSLDSNTRQRSINCTYYLSPRVPLQLPPGTGYSPYSRCSYGDNCTSPLFWYGGKEYNVPVEFRVNCDQSVGYTYNQETGVVTCTPDTRPPPLYMPPMNGQSSN